MSSRPGLGAALSPAEGVLRGYAGLYERRQRTNVAGELFRNPEANALAALAIVGMSTATRSPVSLHDPVAFVAAVTRRLVGRARHSWATDMAGLAWTRAYGTLAIDRPPLEQIEFVLESGNVPGRISGAYGAGWRALFLLDAMPLLNWRQRPIAGRQLDRWIGYATDKAVQLTNPTAGPLSGSQAARISYVLGELAQRAPSSTLGAAVSALAAAASSEGHDVPTAVAAQIVASAYAVGNHSAGDLRLERLFASRLDRPRMLLHASDHEDRDEASPWVPLALLRAGTRETGA